ncbi:MAG TPA: NifU family protein [Nitrospirae bacterium]|nr:NifU family protein [Nitrospirota bacterium]
MDRAQIEAVLEKVREGLRKEGGDIELIDVKGTVVYVRLTGECKGCMMAGITMKNWVERIIKEELPGVTEVRAV